MASTIQIRVEDELKSKSDALFKDLGTDTTTAIRMFLTQAIAANGFPFEIKRQLESKPYALMTEKEILAKLKKSREKQFGNMSRGILKRFLDKRVTLTNLCTP